MQRQRARGHFVYCLYVQSLKAYRARPGAGVLFGIYVTPILGGGGAPGTRVRVGDEVEAV